MKFLGRTQMLSQYPLVDSLSVIKQLGFDGVEICVERQDWSLHSLDTFPTAALREAVAELGLAPHSFSFHQNFIFDDERFELTKQAIPMTRELGTKIFVYSGAVGHTGDADEWRRMVERTRVFVEIAEEHGVVLAQEFEPNFVVGSTADLLRLFDEIPSPNLAANLDLGHVFLCDPDPMQAIRAVGDKIVHCHVSNMPTGLHDHLVPGEGDMDLSAYLQAVADVGFDGGLALDLYKYDYEAVAAQAVADLRGVRMQIEGASSGG